MEEQERSEIKHAMCLDARSLKVRKTPLRKPMKAWKVFRVNGFTIHGMEINGFFGYVFGTSINYKPGKTYTATLGRIHIQLGLFYPKGFHAFVTRRAALAYGGIKES